MPSIRQSIRSSTASKRPTSAIADGQIALNTASGTPGLFFKDSANNIIKAGPAHYGASAPNSSPAVGGSTGNSIAEAWLDSSLTPPGWKIWSGSAWVNATPLSSDTVQGLVELATNAETQAGVDAARAVTSASLQSKVSDSISTTSSSGIASSTAVKTAYDLANAALPKSGGIVTGNLEIGTTGSLTFEGSSADGFETALAVVNPTADRTITFPNVTGTVVTTGDSGTVTGTMIADSTIVNAEVSPTAAIAFSKLASLTSANIIVGNASGVPTATAVTGDVTITNSGVTAIASNVIVNADINSAAAIAYSKLALSSGITNTDVSASAAIVYSKLALSSGITNTDVNASAAIAGTKISPNFGSQNIVTTGNITAANHIAASGTAAAPSIAFSGDTNTGIYSPSADQLAIATAGTGRVFVSASGVGMGVSLPQAQLQILDRIKISDSTQSQGSLQLGDGASTLFNVGLARWNGSTNAPGAAGLGYFSQGTVSSGGHYFYTGDAAAGSQTARMTIAAGGDVGIGTMSPSYKLTTNGSIGLGVVSNGTTQLVFDGSIGGDAIGASAAVQGTYTNFGTNSNGALLFLTNSSSALSEKARIDSSGRLLVGTSSYPGNGNEKLGISSSADGIWIDATGAGGTGVVIDRTTADGDLINFLQAGTQEGVISVAGTTVTYGGGHLARWSQLPNNEDPSQLLKGTVMSNLNEMCEWGEEDNEQLNKTKVSDVEGDKNVAGVFVSTSFSDDGPLDFFVGMTGDMVIRIAEGVTVERGDLLMSAGDGTAKPQDDDIIRSKTIAKVTSTHASCTYEDGSYCVPCVLMAC